MRFSAASIVLLLSTLYASTSATEEDTSALRHRTYELPYEAPVEEEPSRRIFVKYRKNRRSAFETEISKRSSKVKLHYDFQRIDTFVLTVPESEVEAFKKNPNVEMVHDDVPRYPQYIVDSVKRRKLQSDGEVTPYGVDLVQAKEVWALGARGKGVTVCIVDTGVDEAHEDLVGVTGVVDDLLPFGSDGVGHGTHCAGTVAAAENGKGVVGVAPDASIYSVKVFSDSGGFAYSSGILGAAQECVENGADIISMSLGGPLPNIFEILGFRQLLKDNGVISVAAAGNSGNGMWSFPASYPGVVSVAALDKEKKIAPFSQSNRQVDIAAPGVDVYSTFPMEAPCSICERANEYEYGTISGTSMATPHVAGVLALLKSFKPDATPEELIDAMQSSAEDLGSTGKDKDFGHGLVQAFAAVERLNGGAFVTESFSQQPDKASACGDDEVLFDLKMLTDDRASETYWELRRITDSGVELSGAGYDDNTAITVKRCVPKNCYTFTVYDSAGDGK